MLSSSDFEAQTNESGGNEPEPQSQSTQEQYEEAMKPLTRGEIITGTIVHLDDQGALVDVGTKSEGVIPPHEIGSRTTGEGEPLAVGQQIEVYVLKPEDEEGGAVLSKKRADYEAVWHKILHSQEVGEILSAMVTERVKGGLVVDLGVRAFMPASHVNVKNVAGLENLVGRVVKLKILEVDRERKRVVVSQKEAVSELRAKRRETTMASLKEGMTKKGTVRRITDYGAFVDLGGVDGLLHITEMSWTYISHPSDVLKPGERIEVMILKVDHERGRISLGLKQIQPDPWDEIASKYHVGDTVSGRVTRVVAAGAFLRLPEGVEGIIPASELSPNRKVKPEEMDLEGKEIEAKVIAIRPGERRITFSLRSMHTERERKEMRSYMDGQGSGRVTIGDILGEKGLTEAMAQSAAQPEAPPQETAPEEEPAPRQAEGEVSAETSAAETAEADTPEEPAAADSAAEGAEIAAQEVEAAARQEAAKEEAAEAEAGPQALTEQPEAAPPEEEKSDAGAMPLFEAEQVAPAAEEPCESSDSPEASEPEKAPSPDSSEDAEPK